MKNKELNSQFKIVLRAAVVFVCLSVFSRYAGNLGWTWAAGEPPTPLLEKGHPVDWWFVFKFNTASFPGCGGGSGEQRTCPFGGTVQPYPRGFGQQFVYASSEDPSLQKGSGCAGETPNDPLGATFAQVYDNAAYYVIWNDQFYSDPRLNCVNPQGYYPAPWGHSKGLLAWNAAGEGLVSALLGGVSLRVASWWSISKIYTTTNSAKISCWDSALGKPGRVEIATTGQWGGKELGLEGGSAPRFNHAKIGATQFSGI